jgi:hypothetical protein
MDGWIVGRKSIAAYLDCTWRTVVRMKHVGLPLMQIPDGRPVLIPAEANMWLKKYDELKKQNRMSSPNPQHCIPDLPEVYATIPPWRLRKTQKSD